MKQNRQRCDSQMDCSSAAAWKTSFTAGCLLEPTLLLDQTGPRLRCVRRATVIGRMAKQTDRLVCIEFSDLFPFDVVECRGGTLPRLDPSFTEGNLLRSPIREC